MPAVTWVATAPLRSPSPALPGLLCMPVVALPLAVIVKSPAPLDERVIRLQWDGVTMMHAITCIANVLPIQLLSLVTAPDAPPALPVLAP